MDYINHITDGDKELKRLLRVIMGYLFSHYNNGKKAFLIYGIPHTGKSVLCNVIERCWGKCYVSHVDLAMLSKPEFAASLNGSVLNISADLKNESLRDVGFFKSLVSHDDTIASRALYSNPQDIKCETKMIFSTNHLISFDSSLSVYDIEAVFNRLIYVPYLNKPISDKNDNKHLSDEIYDERDAVFTWAIKGLKDYIENNENFPKAKSSEKLKLKNMAKYCPEKIFFEEAIKKEEGVYESSSDIRAAFEVFCQDCEVRGKANIIAFLEEHEHLNKSKKRIDENGNLTSVGNPIYVYEGIRLRNKYRH
jgi:putative DNA primase/helicase